MRRFFKYQLVLCFTILNYSVLSQSIAELPTTIKLIINDQNYEYNHMWLDSLKDEAIHARYCFRIAGVSSSRRQVISHIQLPQTLSTAELYRQIILYYSLIREEELREKEKVLIFPYFQEVKDSPSITVRYSEPGIFEIEMDRWERIPFPPQPGHRDMRIFNEVLQNAFDDVQSFGSLSEEVFEEVAEQNHLTNLQVMNIYKNTILWQQSRFFHRAEIDKISAE